MRVLMVAACLALFGVSLAAFMTAVYVIGTHIIEAVRGPAFDPPEAFQ